MEVSRRIPLQYVVRYNYSIEHNFHDVYSNSNVIYNFLKGALATLDLPLIDYTQYNILYHECTATLYRSVLMRTSGLNNDSVHSIILSRYIMNINLTGYCNG